jgi:hypothetical protein
MHVGFDKQKSWKREKELENREEEVIISCFEARTRRSGLTTSTRYRDLIDTQSLASFIAAPDTDEPGSAALCVLGILAVHDRHSQISAQNSLLRAACCLTRQVGNDKVSIVLGGLRENAGGIHPHRPSTLRPDRPFPSPPKVRWLYEVQRGYGGVLY